MCFCWKAAFNHICIHLPIFSTLSVLAKVSHGTLMEHSYCGTKELSEGKTDNRNQAS